MYMQEGDGTCVNNMYATEKGWDRCQPSAMHHFPRLALTVCIVVLINSLLPQTSNKKSERKRVPLGSAVKPKQNCTQLRGKRTVKNDAAVKDKASEEESEIFPDIEVMSTRQEQGECK